MKINNMAPIMEMDILTKDQSFLLEYTLGIYRCKVYFAFGTWKIGPLSNARWLTLATRLMRM